MKSLILTKKDLRLLARDRRALIVLVVFPLIFITIIGLTTGRLLGWTNSNQILKIAAVDLIDYDHVEVPGADRDFADLELSEEELAAERAAAGLPPVDETPPPEAPNEEELARQRRIARNILVKTLNRIQTGNGLRVTEVNDVETARRQYRDESANVALFFGPEFYNRVQQLLPADIFDRESGRLSDGLASLDIRLESGNPDASTHALVEDLVWSKTIATIAPYVLCKNNFVRQRSGRMCESLDAEADGPPITLAPAKEPAAMAADQVYQSLIPSYTVMFVFFLVNIMARSFIHERELGTLRRLRISPLSPTSLLAGKTIPFLIISLVQTVLLFVCGRLLFSMSWGPQPWLLLPVIFCTSLAATALGLLLATLVRTEAQVSAYANIVVITMAGISGCFMPRKWLPDAMQEISLATPHAWSLIAYQEILSPVTLPHLPTILESCAMLVGFAVLYFMWGSVRFTRIG